MPEKIELDELDIKLLRACQENDGKSLAEILESLPRPRSSRTFYRRFDRLEELGLIEADRVSERGRSLCHITDTGKEVLAGREGPAPNTEREPHGF